MKRLRAPTRIEVLALSVLVATFVAAPTPGDIGGCGQPAKELDPQTFFASKDHIDCQRCQECALAFSSCNRACDPRSPIPDKFPDNCYPLVHDGEVCLRALYNASCSDYLRYMDDFES